MASPAAQLGMIANAALSSASPKRDSAEAACQDVIDGSKAGPEDERCLQAMQDEWRARTAGKDLPLRLVEYLAVCVLPSFMRRVYEERLARRAEQGAFRRASARFGKLVERELASQVVAEPQAGAKIWLQFVQRHVGYFVDSAALLAWHHAVEQALLERLRTAALKALKKSSLSGTARNAAIGRAREVINDHLALYVEHVNAGIDDWHPPPEAFDTMLSVFSGGSAVTGAVGSLLTALLTLEAAPVAFGVGIWLTAVGGYLGAVVAIRGQLAAEAASGQRQVEDRVRDALRTLGRARADNLTPLLDLLATVLVEAAVTAKVDVSGGTGTALSTFVWTRLFSEVPQQRVAAAAYFKSVFDEMQRSAARP